MTLLTATAIAARFGDDDVAAHQVAMQILLFLALSLDALAIAAQAMVGRYLGADSAHDALVSARRLLEWGVIAGVVVGIAVAMSRPWLAALFTNDTDVSRLVEQLLWFVAALQPAAAVVFVLDGVLIGASDAGYLADRDARRNARGVPTRGAARGRARRRAVLAVGGDLALDDRPPCRHGGALPHRPMAGHRRSAPRRDVDRSRQRATPKAERLRNGTLA